MYYKAIDTRLGKRLQFLAFAKYKVYRHIRLKNLPWMRIERDYYTTQAKLA